MKEIGLKKIAKILNCHHNVKEVFINRFEVDSRKIERGNAYIALPGAKVDGHSFLSEAASHGAVVAFVSEDYQGESFGLQLMKLKNVLDSMQLLAKELFSQRQVITIGITGSVGKTSTKENIALLLASKYRVSKTPGNANSQVGIPLSVLNGDEEAEVFVAEMAMSEPGHIQRLTEITPPDIGVITKIGVSHAAFFSEQPENMQSAIACAKAEIFAHPKTKKAILHPDMSHYPAIAALSLEKIYFGKQSSCDYAVHDLNQEGVILNERGELSPRLPVPFQASHLLENFCAAVAVARSLDVSWEEIAIQAAKIRSFPRRFEKIEKQGVTYINDSYNASPESIEAALTNLPLPHPGKKRIAVISEMKELGSCSLSGHERVARCALQYIDHLLCIGEGALPMVAIFQAEGKAVNYFEDFKNLRAYFEKLVETGDLVLIKGANSHALWRLVELM